MIGINENMSNEQKMKIEEICNDIYQYQKQHFDNHGERLFYINPSDKFNIYDYTDNIHMFKELLSKETDECKIEILKNELDNCITCNLNALFKYILTQEKIIEHFYDIIKSNYKKETSRKAYKYWDNGIEMFYKNIE